MKTLPQRIVDALDGDVSRSAWESLIDLYRSDREAFYLLACDGLPQPQGDELRQLAELAGRVRSAVRETYQIEPAASGADLIAFSGVRTPIPAEAVSQVREFLREIDGKTTSDRAGKDYEGSAISEAEMRFKLGNTSDAAAQRPSADAALDAEPFVLHVADDDLQSLATHPRYVTWELLHCARRTVLVPRCVYKGLKRGGRGLPTINDGWAFCGKPRQAYDNTGKPFPAPTDKLFVVYADAEGYVFDWDWIQEDPHAQGHPLDPELRFEGPQRLDRDAVLDLPPDLQPGQFDPKVPSYSGRGDCIFCYMSEDVSFAERINADLTIFKSLQDERITGFKVKNVQRILEENQSIVLDDAPGLTVSVKVRSVLLATLQRNPEAEVRIYDVLIAASFTELGDPGVRVPRRPAAQASRAVRPEMLSV